MLKEVAVILNVKNAEPKTFIINESQTDFQIGRHPECGIYVNDSSVSSRHGHIFLQDGQLFYADLNSTNGSFIDDGQIKGATALRDGSVVKIAGVNSDIKLTVKSTVLAVSLPEENALPAKMKEMAEMTSADGGGKQEPPISSALNNLNGVNNKNEKSDDGIVLIGRDPSCGIFLPNLNVSRFHAKFIKRDGRFYVEDNNSTNGTFINGVRINRVCEISANDEVYVASVRLRVKNGILTQDEVMGGLSVQVRGLYREVPDGSGKTKILLDHISLSVESNEFVAVIGGSGAGKSTFTNVLCGKTPPSAYKGHIGFNNSPAGNRNIFKSVVGYAPQNDVLYHDLTLYQMLYYSAKLKMPQDTKPGEYDDRVNYVINKVELAGHENTLVRRLSGGQQKRASIAVELLSDPKLFFLDEPTSGLGPATERKLMRMLKGMTIDNKTIIAVTHVTQNLNLCDKVIVLGKGGKLCFFGTPQDTCEYFGVTDIVDIYDKINDNPAVWQQKYQEMKLRDGSQPETVTGAIQEAQGGKVQSNAKKRDMKSGYNSGWSQFLVLAARYLRLTFGDPKRCLLLLLQAPILGILLMLVSNSSSGNAVFDYSASAKSMLFSLTCAAFWVGMLNSIQEICKEKDIFAREKMSTVRLFPYIASKITIIGILCVFQSFVLVLIAQIFSGLPENSLGIQPFFGFFITACLTTVCAACLGLAVSSLSPNPDRAMAIAPIILLPQILFSGVVFELTGLMNLISNIIPCKLSMQNFGTLTNFNALPTSQDVAEKSINAMYSVTNADNIYGTWQGLLISSIVYIVIFTAALQLKSKE